MLNYLYRVEWTLHWSNCDNQLNPAYASIFLFKMTNSTSLRSAQGPTLATKSFKPLYTARLVFSFKNCKLVIKVASLYIPNIFVYTSLNQKLHAWFYVSTDLLRWLFPVSYNWFPSTSYHVALLANPFLKGRGRQQWRASAQTSYSSSQTTRSVLGTLA